MSSSSQHGVTRLSVLPLFDSFRSPSAAPLRLPVLFEILTDASEATRPAFDVGLVLDFSGSMSGSKIASLKEAALFVLDSLRDDDVFTIIVYTDSQEVVAEAARGREAKDAAAAALRQRQAGGGTNISDALELCAMLMTGPIGADARAEQTRMKRIFLFSDGQPGSGFTTLEQFASLGASLRDRGLSVWTFGIGEDINEELMRSVAFSGDGHYDFVSVRRIEEMTKRAVGGLERMLGTRATLEIRFPSLASSSFLDSAQCRVTDADGNPLVDGVVDVGDIRYQSRRQILAFLNLPPPAITHVGQEVLVATAVLSFAPVDSPLAPYVSISTDVVLRTSSVNPPQESMNPSCKCAIAMQNAKETFARVAQMLEESQLSAAESALAETLADLALIQDIDMSGFVETQLRRGRRLLERLSHGGLREARGVVLDLNHQTQMMDRMSEMDFQASEMGSEGGGSGGPQADGSPHPRAATPLRRTGSGSSFGSDENTDRLAMADQFDMMLERLPGTSSPGPARGNSASSSPIRFPPPLELPPSMVLSELALEVPSYLVCPITGELMAEPVMTADGHTYERKAVQKWFDDGNFTSPITNLPLQELTLRPNFGLRGAIEAFITALPK